MAAYGTKIVAGVTPGRGGELGLDGTVPVFDTVREAVEKTGANTSCIFVPAAGAADAIAEAASSGIKTIFCITEGIPVHDMVGALAVVQQHGARLIGPNCPGATTPGVNGLPGDVGVVSRSGTLTYEAVQSMTDAGIGQSTCLGIGGDPIIGTTFRDALELFAADPATRALVLIGEIGGSAEEEAAAWAGEHLKHLPRVAFIAGRAAPEGRRMGHAGAIVSGASGRAIDKIAALEAAGFKVAGSPTELPRLLIEAGYTKR
jgi:succinyl-CoA synthetase alpha subunit